MDRRRLIKVLAAGAAAGGLGGLYYTQQRGRAPTPLKRTASPSTNRTEGFPLQFLDVTPTAGISFQHNSGAFGKKYLPETLGSGCAFFDYDNDGWPDILLVNSMDWAGHTRQRSTMKLYRNNRNGTFTDVTRGARLDVEMYGIGVAAGEYD